MKTVRLLASAPTLESLYESISHFYGGETKKLRMIGQNTWVVESNGNVCDGVRVTFKRNRYRFEVIE